MYIIDCPGCGRPKRKARIDLITINCQVIQPDELDDPKVAVCTNPKCPKVHKSAPSNCIVSGQKPPKRPFKPSVNTIIVSIIVQI
jgi:hypothetical protein